MRRGHPAAQVERGAPAHAGRTGHHGDVGDPTAPGLLGVGAAERAGRGHPAPLAAAPGPGPGQHRDQLGDLAEGGAEHGHGEGPRPDRRAPVHVEPDLRPELGPVDLGQLAVGQVRRLARLRRPPDRRGHLHRGVPVQQADADAAGRTRSAPRLARLRAVREQPPPMRGWLAVPLIASDGHNLGLIQVSDKYEGEFTIDDEAILTQLAELASACIEKAAALDKQREIARTLQRSLLPPHLPDIPGVELAARYDPADDDSQVGGDFYDLFQARDGRWCVILGDVCGKDAEAATVTALMRHTARAAAMTDPDPAHVAELLNRAVLAHGTDRFCTLVYLTLLPEPDKAQVDLVVCGHPLPLCVDADGAVSEVGEPGMLIGVLEELSPRPTRFTMGPGDTLVLFTDGLTEARRHGPMFGETMLPALLGHAARRPVRELADIVARAALDYQGGRLKDDIATLFLRVGRDDGGGSLR
ncbi:PP2C family protein-serine/threonine phosphatase [Thermocatellispora tengchongensis]|uniref:PP2C family protein-serine/threonine phosphatase n=1 Tax=Thermocatellispora tengchongensis TaxID=1073253 RepID=UPI0036294491